MGDALIPLPIHVPAKGCFHVQTTCRVTSAIEIQKAVKTNAERRGDIGSDGRERLQTATRANSHHGQASQRRLHRACFKIYVCQGVKFVQHDVNVVAADAR